VVIHESLRQRLQEIFQLAIENTAYRRPILYLHGRSGVGKKTVARALCSAKDLMLAAVDVRSLLRNPEAFQEKVRLILREGLLQPAAIYFGHLEKLESAAEENLWLLNGLLQEIAEFGWIIFLGSENPLPSALLNLPAICPVEVPAPDHAEQKALWKICLDGALSEKDMPNLDLLATRFDLTGGQIAQAIRRAQQVALVRDPKNGHLALADLMASSRLQSQPKLSVLARKIEPKYHWRDIVLPEDQMVQLRELANQLKHKQTVMEEWGFARKLSLGKGLNALFAGPSGTGKTMAAEVIAHELGLDLYKIDLSAVVSKYIGETEKNLNRVFTEAEYSNAILFFDEADALLGKRSEVKDAHDRYANIEIAYLLQKMEEYTGVTILSTNLKKNIDDAFVRRMQFIIDFPFPDEKHREKIWRVVFPPETPLSLDIDFKLLAKKLKITGGNIRNISLKAAYFAAADGRQITMNHLARATKREFQKMGKLYLEADFYRDGKVLD
jgi:SpoVK/Ycf46/Vps4 family AAA+-type ATPase